jgi:hypothetical protein
MNENRKQKRKQTRDRGSEIAEKLKQTEGIGYVRRKTTRKDEKDDEKTTERRNRRTRDADTTKDGSENNRDVEIGGIRYPDKEDDGMKRELEGSMNDRRTDTK